MIIGPARQIEAFSTNRCIAYTALGCRITSLKELVQQCIENTQRAVELRLGQPPQVFLGPIEQTEPEFNDDLLGELSQPLRKEPSQSIGCILGPPLERSTPEFHGILASTTHMSKGGNGSGWAPCYQALERSIVDKLTNRFPCALRGHRDHLVER